MQLLRLRSPDDLRRHALPWDDLWRRSETALPTLRAEALALWLRHFAGRRRFEGLVVEDSGRFLAALPLVNRRLKGLLKVADLPNCPWSVSGDLLLDPACDTRQVLDQLVSAAAKLPHALLWFDGVDIQSSRWQAWLGAVGRAGLAINSHPRYEVGIVDRTGDWQAFTEQHLAGDFRRNVRRRLRQFEEQGAVSLRSYLWPHDSSEEVQTIVRRAFEIEDFSWKGAGRTSVIKTPGMLDFFVRQARLLASWDQLAIYFLELNDRPIAFEFGYFAKGVYFAHKIGYLDEYAKSAPGHLLRWLQMQSLWQQPDFRAVDFFGVLTDATRRWSTRTYPMARVVVAPPRLLSRVLLAMYEKLWSRVRGLRQKGATVVASPEA
jgi:CelD/BcsL family acetyltransferase involved in cellulose biosynthesis